MEFETRLQILNESIAFLFDKLSFNQNESDKKNTGNVYQNQQCHCSIKIELRSLSVTLFDFKEHTDMKTESRDKKI